jgi:tetratricopeptide (TPR) repeat protein
LRWDHALATDRILSEKAKEKIYRPRLREGEDRDSYYGYGWDVHRTPRQSTRYWHNGSNGIFYADFYRFADESTSVILLTNKSNGIQRVAREIGDALFTAGYIPVVPILDNVSNRSFTDRIVSIAMIQGAEAGDTALRERAPDVNLLEGRVNERGYALLNDGDVQGAIRVFRLNVSAFPGSANTYDSLGEAFMTAGDTSLAIENYRKSLILDPGNANAEEMLKRLERR